MGKRIKRQIGSDDVYFFEVFEDFLERKKATGVSDSTVKNYRMTFHVFTEYYKMDESTTCKEIQEQKIYQWINHMRNEDLSASSINHYIRDMRCFLYDCMAREYVEPAFKINCIKVQEEQLKFFNEEELELLLEKPRKNAVFGEWRTWAIVNFILATGARAGTVCNVKMSDINFTKKEIVFTKVKTKQIQIVPLSSSLETALKEYIRIWRHNKVDGWLFSNIEDEKLTVNALHQAFTRYCEGREVENTNVHGLRHSFARGWIKNNGNTIALQNIMGHSTIDMTRKYVKLFGEDLKEGYEDFAPLDTIKKSKSRKMKVQRN